MVFQFPGCLYHGHDCCKFEDTWLCTTAKERRQSTEENKDYVKTTCVYTLVTIWECEWKVLKRCDPRAAMVCKGQTGNGPQPPLPGTTLPDPGADMQSILQAIREDWVFGLAQVDIHTNEDLKDKFHDLPPIFKSAVLSKEDAGPHMARFCKTTGLVSQPRMSLISSYFSRRVLIPTPFLQWYLLNGLMVTQLYILMQYDRRQCFQALAENCAPKWRDTRRDPLQALAWESAKLLMTSVYRKCCENKVRFMQTYFVKGPAASKTVCSKHIRDSLCWLQRWPTRYVPVPRWTWKTCLQTDGSLRTWSMQQQWQWIPTNCLWRPNVWPWTFLSRSPSLYTPMLSCICYSSGMTCWASTWTSDAGRPCIWIQTAITSG